MKKKSKFLKILFTTLFITQCSFVSISANDNNVDNTNDFLLKNYEDYNQASGRADFYGNWRHTAESSSTGVLRLVLAGKVYYSNDYKVIGASDAYISEYYYGAYALRIDSQSKSINSTKGATYNIEIGVYEKTGTNGKLVGNKYYNFTKNPGPI